MAVQDKDKIVSLEDLKTAYDDLDGDISDLKNTLSHKADLIYDIASGDIASFPDGADGLPVKDLTVAIEPVQSGTGDPSPTNVRPISGWTGCNVSHSGADTSDPTVIPISWQSEAGTVYGGTLDVTSGVLTVTMASVDMGTLEWVYSSSGNRFTSNKIASLCKKPATDSTVANIVSPIFKVMSLTALRNSGDDNLIALGDTGSISVRYNSSGTDADAFTTAMSGVQLVYELATPQTYQLAPTEVTTLLGQNNIWADCGPSTVEYPCDTKLYIERLTAPEEDDMIANQNIASGVYFMVGNNLYLSTASIAANEAIKPGTGAGYNCIAKSLADALNDINS